MPDKKIKDSELLIRIDERLKSLEEKFDDFKTRLDKDLVKQDEFQQVKDDVCWLKKFFWIVATTAIGAVLSSFLNLLKLFSK